MAAVLSIRFEEGGYLGKAPAGEFQRIRVSVLNFRRCSSNFRLLYTDRFISDQNLPCADMQACSLSFTQKVLGKDIW